MRLLILGGTWFVGRAVAEAAVRIGWQVTCFNRGRTGPDIRGAESVRGDRTSAEDLARLSGHGPWDAVVDTGAYEPALTRLATNALTHSVGHYLMVSTVSAYRDWPAEPVDEASALWPARLDARQDDPEIAALPVPVSYGMLKAGCEAVVEAAFGDRALVLRPGVVLGPYEYVGRLDALLRRAAPGGRMLVAGDPQRAIQPIDVRDLAAFVLHALDRGLGGAYNAVAPRGHATYGDLIRTCVEVTGAVADPVWVDAPWLVERGVREWTQLVLWRTAPWHLGGGRQPGASGWTRVPALGGDGARHSRVAGARAPRGARAERRARSGSGRGAGAARRVGLGSIRAASIERPFSGHLGAVFRDPVRRGAGRACRPHTGVPS